MNTPSEQVDHQRTYRSGVVLHERLSGFVGQQVALREGVEFTVARGIGRYTVDRTLITHWFDSESRSLYRAGAMLRCRGRQTNNDVAPKRWQVESRVRHDGAMHRVRGAVLSEPSLDGVKPDAAMLAVAPIIGGQPLIAAASQTKVRRLLPVHSSVFGCLAPEIVIALDEVQMQPREGQPTSRLEVELQLFTQLPWNRRVTRDRVRRFAAFAEIMEQRFQLEPSLVSSHQAVPDGLLS